MSSAIEDTVDLHNAIIDNNAKIAALSKLVAVQMKALQKENAKKAAADLRKAKEAKPAKVKVLKTMKAVRSVDLVTDGEHEEESVAVDGGDEEVQTQDVVDN